MASSLNPSRGTLRAGTALLLTLVVLAVLAWVLREFGHQLHWPFLLDLLGGSTAILGVLCLLREAIVSEHVRMPAVVVGLSLVLSGGVLLGGGGGWGAAIGLGLIGGAGLVVERRGKDRDTGENG